MFHGTSIVSDTRYDVVLAVPEPWAIRDRIPVQRMFF